MTGRRPGAARWWEQRYTALSATVAAPGDARPVMLGLAVVDPTTGAADLAEWPADRGLIASGGLPLLAEMAALDPIVCADAAGTWRLLDAESRHYFDHPAPVPAALIDPCVIEAHLHPAEGLPTFVELAARYGRRHGMAQPDSCVAQALVAARVVWLQMRRTPHLAALSAPQLAAHLAGWRRRAQTTGGRR